MAEQKKSTPLIPVLNLLAAFLSTDLTKIFAVLVDLFHYFKLFQPRMGLYEVLDYETRLELHDVSGHDVTYFKRQRVRFLQNSIIAYQDQAWGDGDIFAEYQCSPGIPVDRYREGHRYRILISLRQTKNRGDIEEFHIQRRIIDGFTHATEDFQTEVDHRTHKLTSTIIFPKERLPQEVIVIEQKAGRTQVLDREHFQILPDGRCQVTWQTAHPKHFEAYILRWKW